ncbi:MAG: YceI family protein, partial [Campylobacteraceae bacterium]|nr:YceI family protein [Campylobacteraceae bacterium]
MTLLNINEFRNWDESDYTLIHVLPEEHFKNVHIKNALNICVYEMSFFDKVKELDLNSNDKIVVYGDSVNDLDAKAASGKLLDLGFNNIFVLEGGINSAADILELVGDNQSLNADQHLILEDKSYEIVEESKLHWSGQNANGKHTGEISLRQGNLEVKNKQLKGEFIIDMNSIKTLDLTQEQGASYLDAHLKSDDFFLSKLFPEAKFTFKDVSLEQIAYQTTTNCIIDGELSIRGISKKQSVNALIAKV